MARYGLRTEVLLSLGLVMLLATVVLVAVFLTHHEQGLRIVLGRSLLAEAAGPFDPMAAVAVGTEWWWIDAGDQARPRGGLAGPIDPASLELARRARDAGAPLLQLGRLGDRIRFATPGRDEAGEAKIAVARLPIEASARLRSRPLAVVGLIGLANVAIFTAFGAWSLRRRVIGPLEAVARAANEIAAGARDVRAPAEGPAEVAGVARALNEMTDALQGQSEELEKAVGDLRGANRELRQARAGLDRAERLASVGRLAAGVAHEVGNPIGAILAFIDLALRDEGLSETGRDHLNRAGREGERVRTILRQLLDFSRPVRLEPRPMDFAQVASETLALITAQRRYRHLRVEPTLAHSLPPVMGDPSVVTQILLNLLLNAADAIAERGGSGGRVQLVLRATVLESRGGDADDAVAQQRRADAVECLVCDDGCGISEADREQIFDPFYTTKDPGEGTGLGLANSARLAEELGGAVECLQPPEGFRTAIALRLPVVPAHMDAGSGRARTGMAA